MDGLGVLGFCWVVGSLREGGKGKIGVGDCWEGGFIKRSLRSGFWR